MVKNDRLFSGNVRWHPRITEVELFKIENTIINPILLTNNGIQLLDQSDTF